MQKRSGTFNLSCLILTKPTSSIVRDVGRRNGTLLDENSEEESIAKENACSKNETGQISFTQEMRPKRSKAVSQVISRLVYVPKR